MNKHLCYSYKEKVEHTPHLLASSIFQLAEVIKRLAVEEIQ